jgi:cell division protein FtsB
MAQMKRRGWFTRVLASRFTLGLLIVLFLFLIRGVWRLYFDGQLVAAKRAETEQELAKLNQREVELAASIKALATSRGIEAKIREDFPVAKDGESVISILPAQGGATTTATSTPSSWWGTIVHWFTWW